MQYCYPELDFSSAEVCFSVSLVQYSESQAGLAGMSGITEDYNKPTKQVKGLTSVYEQSSG